MDQKAKNDFELRKIKDEIKRQLRQRSLTYDDLAAHLDISTSSVKRALGKEDLSISRLNEIAGFLGMAFWELVTRAQDPVVVNDQFTAEQEEFLAKNPAYYHFLLHILHRGDVEWIAQNYRLNDVSIETYLDTLERFELIVRLGERQANVRVSPLVWLPGRPLFHAYGQKALAEMYERCNVQFRSSLAAPNAYLKCRIVLSRPESFQEYARATKDLCENFIQESKREQKLFDHQELTSAWIFVAGEERDLWNDVLGPIPNIGGK